MKRAPLPQITIGLTVTLGLLILNTVISVHNILKLIKNQQLVSHTYQVLAISEETLSTLKDTETGQRGYLLTGKESYLKPYKTSIKVMEKKMAILTELTGDNLQQQKRIKVLKETISQKLAELQETIQLRQQKGINAALQVVQSDRGNQLMEKIRQQIATIKAKENELLEQRTESSQVSAISTVVTFIFAMALNILLLFLLYYLIRRNEAKRNLEAEVQHQLIIELTNSEEKFRQLAENISEIVFWISTPQDDQMLYVSPAYERIWGRSCDLVYHDFFTWVEAIHPEDREQVRHNFTKIVQKGVYNQEYRIVQPDGSIRWIRDRRFTIKDYNGEPYRIVGIAEDFTERKQAELQLKEQSTALTKLNKSLTETSLLLTERNLELDRFTHNISHDLKAPLRAVSNLSQWICDDLEGELNPETKRMMTLLQNRVYRMERLISGLLAYSRIGRTEILMEEVNVAELIAEILDSLAPPADFIIAVQPEMPTFNTRRLLLSQVFANLISNAIKHSDRTDGRIEISATSQEEYYEFSVADNGRGIAPENHERIFAIFQTVKEDNDLESTGIGLSIVKKIVETEGGQIFLKSELGQGATFRFTWLIES